MDSSLLVDTIFNLASFGFFGSILQCMTLPVSDEFLSEITLRAPAEESSSVLPPAAEAAEAR